MADTAATHEHAVTVFEIVSYQYDHYTGRHDGVLAAMRLTGASGQKVAVHFRKVAPGASLPESRQLNAQTWDLECAYDALPVIVDMLRHEKPVKFYYQGAANGSRNAILFTGTEPVGHAD